MKIEAGKYYKMRNGGKAFVECVSKPSPFDGKADTFPVLGFIESYDGARTWTYAGKYDASMESDRDLIAEWREPVTKEVTVYLRQDKEHREIWAAIDCVECGNFKTIGSAKVTLTEGKFA